MGSVICVTIGAVQRHGGGSVAQQKRIRWYNPKLVDALETAHLALGESDG
jgi:hypothetical protein